MQRRSAIRVRVHSLGNRSARGPLAFGLTKGFDLDLDMLPLEAPLPVLLRWAVREPSPVQMLRSIG